MPAALVLLALAGPMANANHGGFHYAGTLTGAFATPIESSSDNFKFHANAGDVITVTVEWFDPTADLDVLMVPPGGGCTILPTPDVPCLIGAAGNAAGRVTCPAGTDGRTLLGTSPETLTYQASRSGTHTLVVAANAGDTLVNGISYVMSVDGGSDFQQPTKSNWLRLDACRSV